MSVYLISLGHPRTIPGSVCVSIPCIIVSPTIPGCPHTVSEHSLYCSTVVTETFKNYPKMSNLQLMHRVSIHPGIVRGCPSNYSARDAQTWSVCWTSRESLGVSKKLWDIQTRSVWSKLDIHPSNYGTQIIFRHTSVCGPRWTSRASPSNYGIWDTQTQSVCEGQDFKLTRWARLQTHSSLLDLPATSVTVKR